MRRPLPAALTLWFLVSCGGGSDGVSPPPPPPPPPPPAPVASVTLNPGAATLVSQQTTQLTATPKDAAGNALAGRAVTWSTSAAGIATVNAGLVTAVSIGSATITATSEGQNGSATITVQEGGVANAAGGTITAVGGSVSITLPAQAISGAVALTVAPLTNPPAGSQHIPGTAYDLGPSGTQFAQPVTLRIRYEQSQVPPGADPTLFRLHLLNGASWEAVPGSTVDVGTRTVTGTTTHFSGYAVSQIPVPVASVVVSPPGTFNLALGSTQQLTATPKDAAGNPLIRATTWNTSAGGIASVSNTGLVTALGQGNATITATSDGVTGQVVVTVTAAVAFALAQVSPGYHTCGLTAAGAAWCWGQNNNGQVGDGSTTQRLRPVPIPGHVFSQIVVGLGHTCGLKAAGSVWCWGGNAEGELGDGTFQPRSQPFQVLGVPALASITAGSLHTCGRTSGGQAWCWGDNRFGQLGDNSLLTRNQPVPVNGSNGFVQLSAGADRTCGVTLAAQAWCWGNNGGAANPAFPNDGVGLLGTGSLATPVTQPATVAGNNQWVEVIAGYRYSCGRTVAGLLRCWGANHLSISKGGLLGDGSLVTRIVPVPTATGAETFSSVGAGFYSACARSTVGEAWCWGANYGGEVGDGGPADLATSTHHPTPIKVVDGHIFSLVSAGKLNACGIKANGETWCWGYNFFGELGDGTTTSRSRPGLVSP